MFSTLQIGALQTVSPQDHLAAVLELFITLHYDLPRQLKRNLLMKVWSYDWERIARTATEIHLVGILFSYCILIFGPLAALFYFPSVQFSHSGGSKRLQETKCSSWTHCCPFQSSRKALTFSCAGAPNANSMLAGPPGKTHMCVLHTAFVFCFFHPTHWQIFMSVPTCAALPLSPYGPQMHTHICTCSQCHQYSVDS